MDNKYQKQNKKFLPILTSGAITPNIKKIKLKESPSYLSFSDYNSKSSSSKAKNSNNHIITNQKQYLNIFSSSKKEKDKKLLLLPKQYRLNSVNDNKKKIKKKYNTTILQKFNNDLKKYFINSLNSSKIQIQKNIDKLNKTSYDKKMKNSNFNIPKKITNKNNTENNSIILSEKSQKSESNKSFTKDNNFNNNNNLEDKILKTEYSSQLIKYNKNYKRKRNFKNYLDEKTFSNKNWNSKLGIYKSILDINPLLINNVKFQSGLIKDELCLLFDDIQYYRLTFFGNDTLYSSFINMAIKEQIKINKIIEESCALLYYIPKIILKEYYFSTDKFIAIEDPSKELFHKRVVYNEKETFQDNLKYLYKISNFVKCCTEVYLQLISQIKEDMQISCQNFSNLREILKRIRFNIINLTNISKNILKNYCFDKYVIINEFKNALKKSKENFNKLYTNNKYRKYIKNKKYKLKFKKNLKLSTKIETNLKNKISKNIEEDDDDNKEEQEKYSLQNFRKNYGKEKNYILDKINRISKALELNNIYNNDDKNNKKEKFKEKDINIKPMACINSVLMAKMLKYINKESREQIISLRTCERHLNNQSDD